MSVPVPHPSLLLSSGALAEGTPHPSPNGIFVTGTDTGVGKTLISCALLHAYAAMGKRAVGMKPVAAGCEGEACEDVALLMAASSIRAPADWVNPYAFVPPIAPHVAAQEAGVTIRLETIRDAYQNLANLAEMVVVEGVGGFRVPLNRREDTADLAAALGLPVVLVVGMRLGCLSHALLTAEVVAARGLRLAGWVANHIDPAMERFGSSLDALRQRLDAPLLAVVEYAPHPDPAAVARELLVP